MDLSTVIINYNSFDLLKKCVASLLIACKELEHEIFIVDNASPEGFQEECFSSNNRIHVIKNKTNLGFAKANNKALKECKGKYVLLLNPDVEIRDSAIKEMVNFLQTESNAGGVGCKTYWFNGSKFQFSTLKSPDLKTAILENTIIGKLFPENRFFKKIWDIDHIAWSSKKPVSVKGMPAALLMIKKEVLKKINYFDEDFFLYYEDKDLCKRIIDEGYAIFFLPNAEVIHHYGQSTKKENTNILNKMIKESRDHYYVKHFGWQGSLLKLTSSVNDYITKNSKKFLRILNFNNSEQSTEKMDIKLSWKNEDCIQKYCLEISVEPHFLHKVGQFLNCEEYTLTSEMISKIPPAKYFWRCIGFKENGEMITLNSGNFVKQ